VSAFLIRPASFDDLSSILDIHNDIILNSTAIWQEQPDDLAERRAWMQERFAKDFPVLVAEQEGRVIAFASYGTWRTRCGYFKTVEHTVHVHRSHHRQGIGKALMLKLIEIARKQGRHVMIGGICHESEDSLRFHANLGFQECGRMEEVGYKFGRWLDLVFMQKRL
jgi:L-amino acid N-acyltransferase YncA